MSVTFTLIPSPINVRIAGMPSGVAGTFIMTFGRSSAANRRFASSTVLLVSCARCGLTSNEAYPSPPRVSSKMGRSRSAAAWMSAIPITSKTSAGLLPDSTNATRLAS